MQQTPIVPEPSRAALRRLALQLGLEFVTLDPARGGEPDYVEIGPLAASLIPEAVCRSRRVLAIAYRDGVVTIASPDPFADVRDLTDRPARVVATTAEDLEAAFARVFGGAPAPAPAAAPSGRLGERLVAARAATGEQVAVALALQARAGGRVGELLVHAGATAERDVAVAVAEQLDLPFADADAAQPDAETVALVPERLARALRVVPLAAGPGWIEVAAAELLSEAQRDELASASGGRDVRLRLAAPRALEALLRRVHAAEHATLARSELFGRFPDESAARVLSPAQRHAGAALVVAAVVGLLTEPATTATIVLGAASSFVVAATAYRLALAFGALGRGGGLAVSPAELAALDERRLPTYTVLVPLLREAAVLGRLLAALTALDYPRHRLDIRLLVEADDAETLAAAQRADLPPHVTLVEVPPGAPRTKPRALAYGLLLARGERVVVYDAEDRPPPDQLKAAVAAFARAGARVACLQARLAPFNAERGLLERWFAADYAVQFDLLLPALAARRLPLPLGGTSNHLVTERLVELGGWDPYNVTEDADLGIRLHKAGLRTAVLDSTTLEEAPGELGNWMRQRSRWSKGHVQTLLVHLRHPARLARRLGARGSLAFAFVLGGALVPVLAAPFWLLTTLWFLAGPGWLRDVFPGAVFHLAAVGALAGTVGALLLAVAGALQRGLFGSVRHALLAPLAWGLVSAAAWRGVLQLPARAHLWEKTEHGRDRPEDT
ncbi:MAG: glycosyltransferase [Actinobacteria bacterium]|nr:MAG: glycosyltransferase [Actinomycetota bacterium]